MVCAFLSVFGYSADLPIRTAAPWGLCLNVKIPDRNHFCPGRILSKYPRYHPQLAYKGPLIRILTYAMPFYDRSFRRLILFTRYRIPATGGIPVLLHSEAPSKVHSSESSVLPFHHRQLSVTSDLRPVPGTNAAVRSGIQSYPFQGGWRVIQTTYPF